MTRCALLALALVCGGATTLQWPAGIQAGDEKAGQKLRLESAYFPDGSPAGGKTVLLWVELDGKGGGTGSISFDPNTIRPDPSGLFSSKTLIGFEPVKFTLKAIKDGNRTEKGRRMYEIRGEGVGRRLFLVIPAETKSPCWLVIGGIDGAADMIVMRGS